MYERSLLRVWPAAFHNATRRSVKCAAVRSPPQALRFPSRVNLVGNTSGGRPVFHMRPSLHPIAKKGLSFWLSPALRLLPVPLSFAFGEGRAFRYGGTSVGLDGTPSSLALRVLRHPMARAACSSISLGSNRCSAHALWTGDECASNRHQCRVNACDRNAVHSASCEPDVARCDAANAVAVIGRPSAARTV